MKKQPPKFYPSALTVAGSDSGGGAGIQADLRTFNAFGVFGCSAITAITAQNPKEVRRIDAIPAEGVRTQIDAVLDAIPVSCVKTGMLFSREIVSAVAAALKPRKLPLVIDPVMVATSGAVLLRDDAVAAMREELLPLADWITPNIPEAELLLGKKLNDDADYLAAAHEIARLFDCRCFLKTGHSRQISTVATDFVALPDGSAYTVSSPRIGETRAGHGTGCTLSAALASGIALDYPWKGAVCTAKAFVYGSLLEAVPLAGSIEAMYPPEEDYQETVKIQLVK